MLYLNDLLNNIAYEGYCKTSTNILTPYQKYKHTQYYNILQIPPNASEQEIKQAFKKLSLKFHPDKNKNAKKTDFSEIVLANEVLSDKKKRLFYDIKGEGGVKEFEFREKMQKLHEEICKDKKKQDFITRNLNLHNMKSLIQNKQLQKRLIIHPTLGILIDYSLWFEIKDNVCNICKYISFFVYEMNLTTVSPFMAVKNIFSNIHNLCCSKDSEHHLKKFEYMKKILGAKGDYYINCKYIFDYFIIDLKKIYYILLLWNHHQHQSPPT
tara:strand:- start:592 stop:1395 length:804 start_codon:yes stop_codon:yes gene_type:complete